MALSKITNLSILDDTIVNADIKTSAAIALSKLATDPSNASNLASGTVAIARGGTGAATFAAAGLANTPNFLIKQTTPTNLTNTVRTKVNLDSATIDTNSGLDTTNKRWVVPSGQEGTYCIVYSARFESGSTFNGTVHTYLNGSALVSVWGHNVYYETLAGSFVCALVESDYLELYVLQGSGGTITASGPDFGLQTYLGGFKLIE